MLPIPKGWGEFGKDLVLTKGNANISVTEFEQGPAIRIKSRDDLKIEVTKEKLENRVDFSWADREEGMKVFCNKTSVNQKITVDGSYIDKKNVRYDFEVVVKDGWQYISIEGVSS